MYQPPNRTTIDGGQTRERVRGGSPSGAGWRLPMLGLVVLMGCALAAVILYWFANSQRSTEDWWQDAQPIIQAFYDDVDTGGSTSRIALPPVILDMQAQRRKLAALDTPTEAEPARDALIAAMDATIDIIQEFASGKDEADIDNSISITAWNKARDELRKIGIGEM
jgi:hypothetical protein